VSVEDTKRRSGLECQSHADGGGGGGACALRVEMRVCEESGGVDIALGDSVDDNGNCREHNAEEHLGVQVVHGLHGPSADDIVPKLCAGVAHALVEEVPEGVAVGQTQKNETGIRSTINSTRPQRVMRCKHNK
jgi:hypothetical protein